VTSAEAIGDEFHQRPETAAGRAMYDMLLAVHAHIRRDLEVVQGLAAQAVDGVSGTQLHELNLATTVRRLRGYPGAR
jgi:hypothetical protein